MKPKFRVSIAFSPAAISIRAPVSGTRLTHTMIFMQHLQPHRFILSSEGSNRGVLPATATVTG